MVLSAIIFAVTYALTKDFTASGTILLAIATFILAKDSNKNIKISKNNLTQQNLLREMNQLIKKLYKERERLEDLEYAHAYNYGDARSFWEEILADKYLAPKNLRDIIDEYLEINMEWLDKVSLMRKKIANAYEEEGLGNSQTLELRNMFSEHFRYLPKKAYRDDELKRLNELINMLSLGSKIRKCIEEYMDIIREDTILEAKRVVLEKSVEARYKKLEEKMDRIRESLEKEYAPEG